MHEFNPLKLASRLAAKLHGSAFGGSSIDSLAVHHLPLALSSGTPPPLKLLLLLLLILPERKKLQFRFLSHKRIGSDEQQPSSSVVALGRPTPPNVSHLAAGTSWPASQKVGRPSSGEAACNLAPISAQCVR